MATPFRDGQERQGQLLSLLDPLLDGHFSRHQLKEDFAEADPEQRIYHNFEETRKSLRVRDL
jgi:hypothetical protein